MTMMSQRCSNECLTGPYTQGGCPGASVYVRVLSLVGDEVDYRWDRCPCRVMQESAVTDAPEHEFPTAGI